MTAPAVAGPDSSRRRSPWRTRRAVLAHLALLVWVPGCALAAWWQVRIALGGDGLGWVYSVMWPCFAVLGTVFWWYLVHDDPDTLGARGLRSRATAARADGEGAASEVHGEDPAARRLAELESEDPELAAYNAYLSSLAGSEKTWRRP
jgi:hypothetical protein